MDIFTFLSQGNTAIEQENNRPEPVFNKRQEMQ